ncbi:glycoside hydrolase family 97 catalytic domain-containing protein [Novosphingobium aquiterrae]|uniref:Glycoside hydrolase family 97 catalytic domain-containing protein n=1 Tax=Novosphingobium aquiterrae TaxID=624388 RepID=A0ABV6PKE3_9SPHN
MRAVLCRLWLCGLFALGGLSAAQAESIPVWQISSPHGQLRAEVRQSADGGAEYAVSLDGQRVVDWSPLGLTLGWVDQSRADSEQRADFARTVTIAERSRQSVQDAYAMVTGKRRNNAYAAQALTLALTDVETGRQLDLEFQVADDGVAFRYALPGRSALYSWVEHEDTGFAIGLGGTHWGQPYDRPNAWQPAYEAPWNTGLPTGTAVPAEAGPGWSIPALFRSAGGAWILLHESGLTRDYHASHLAPEAPAGLYRIAGPLAADGNGFGDIRAAMTAPAAMPWRFMVISRRLGDIAESNRVFDLAAPSTVADTDWIKPGISSWSWLTDHDSSQDLGKLKAFITLAADRGWSYSLVDANWERIGPDVIEQLVAEGNARGVGVLLWYNSGGRHNAVTEGPRNIMDDRMRRRAEFARLERLGIKGVKIDFFQSDKQERIRQYIEILEDAAAFHLLVNFHGCTVPRGWQRTYPHLMTMEAVRGGEHYTFDSEPDFGQLSTTQNSVLPFTRNVIGSMDFTPVLFSRQRRTRLTTSAHEAALAVVFESGIQHMADGAAGYDGVSADYKRYLANVPTVWDETRFLAGSPGQGIVLARRAGPRWYIAGISGAAAARTLTLDLSFLGRGAAALELKDGPDRYGFYSGRRQLAAGLQRVTLNPYGGFVWVVAAAN